MKWLLIGLAFCSCAYTGLGCLAQGFASQPISGSLPLTMVALRAFTLCSLLCCFLALFRIVPAVVIIWISAITYLAISWRFNASWVFRDDVLRFTLWTPAFLSIAAVFAHRAGSPGLNSKK